MQREPAGHTAASELTPRFHVALSRHFDLAAMEHGADQDRNPRHILYRVQQRLGAAAHVPEQQAVRWIDRLLSLLIAQPAHWALARRLSRELDRGDVVYCAGDDIGMALAIACTVRRKHPTLAVWVMAPSSWRFRAILAALGTRRVEFLLSNTPQKCAQLRDLGVPDRRAVLLPDQTDVRFFSPGARLRESPRPMIFAAGLERRDYRTLALATQDLDLDVCIAAVSPNARATQSEFPDPVPANMSIGDYPWPEYRQALRDAEVVVLPLLPSDYSPGLTVLIEAMACRRPVVATRSPGTIEELIQAGVVVGVEAGDAAGLREAVARLVEDRQAAQAQAERGYRLVLERFDSDRVADGLVTWLESVAAHGLEEKATR